MRYSEDKELEENSLNDMVKEFNINNQSFKDKTIVDFFEYQVEMTPHYIALQYGEVVMTYQEVNCRINEVANYLREIGVGLNDYVAVYIESSIEMFIGIYAVVKSGAAYVPINTFYPNERIDYILKDCNPKIIIMDNSGSKIETNVKRVNINDVLKCHRNQKNLTKISSSKDALYVIYTSGTTGEPKGVVIEHRNVVQLLMKNRSIFDFNNRDIWVMFHSYGFDLSVWEMYGASLYGGKLIILSEKERKDSERLIKILQKEKVTILNQVPSVFYNLLRTKGIEVGLKLRYLIFGGESLRPSMLKDFYQWYKETNIINAYGITETCIHTTFKEIGIQEIYCDVNNIGQALTTSEIYILKGNEICEVGEIGEICVTGDGLARGYLNKEELTKLRFVENPFGNGKMYRSGDLGRKLDNGDVEYIGRQDSQIKINGFRIELEEIRMKLMQYYGVEQAEVLVKEQHNNKMICAYLVVSEKINYEDLRKQLRKVLPTYMIPEDFFEIHSLPVTGNGKLNIEKLLCLTDAACTQDGIILVDKIEKSLECIFCEVLSRKEISLKENLLYLGGYSLKALELSYKIQEEFGVKFSIGDIMHFSTIEEIADNLRERENISKKLVDEICVCSKKEYYVTSSAQKRMYYQYMVDPQSIAYNLPVCFCMNENINENKVQNVLEELVRIHESLRTSLAFVDNDVVQIIHDNCNLKIEKQDVNNIYEQLEVIFGEFVRPFDLKLAPLIRVKLLKGKGRENALLLDMHHIVVDGVSIEILIHDFIALYEDRDVETFKVTYKDYCEWENKKQAEDKMKNKEYWLDKITSDFNVLDLHLGAVEKIGVSRRSIVKSFSLLKAEFGKIKRICDIYKVTPFAVLFSVFCILFQKYSGQDEIIIGTPVAGRGMVSLKRIVGLFSNMIAVRSVCNGNKKYFEYLLDFYKGILDDLEHQDYPLDELINDLGIRKEDGRNPLFNTIFSFQKTYEDNFKVGETKVYQYRPVASDAKVDLNISVIPQNDMYKIEFEYAVDHYNEKIINQMFAHFNNILNEIMTNPAIMICKIDYMTEEEKTELTLYNQTEQEENRDASIIELLFDKVKENKSKKAFISETRTISYEELWKELDLVCGYLSHKGVKPGDYLAIVGKRNIETIICILAIVKMGAVFVPLDEDNSSESLKQTVEKECKQMLFATSLYKESMVNRNTSADLYKVIKEENNDVMYVIYTSGSTGQPKGVVITQRGLLNTIEDINEKIKLTDKDCILSISPINFDLSIYDIFGLLIKGATVAVVEDITNLKKTFEFIVQNKVTVWNSVPTIMEMFSDNIHEKYYGLRQVLLSGEMIAPKLPEQISKIYPEAKIMSLGGATEGSIWSIYYNMVDTLQKPERIPYGYPLKNQKIFILDRWRKQCAPNIKGDIYIGGEGVAKGYYNNVEQTKKAFIQHPNFGYLFYTGDIGAFKDGVVMILGRKDKQVKVNGYRVELREIEEAFLQQRNVEKTVAVFDKNRKVLNAYVVMKGTQNIEKLKEDVSNRLPRYMIPSNIVLCDSIPYTHNGKIDTGRLTELGNHIIDTELYIEPEGTIETTLCNLLEEILIQKNFSVQKSFGNLGLNSAKAIIFVYHINKKFGTEFTIGDLYENDTIRKVAQLVEGREIMEGRKLEAIIKEGIYQTVPSQRSFYDTCMEESLENNSAFYVTLNEPLDKEKFLSVMKCLAEQHEILRTHFYKVDNRVVQEVYQEPIFTIVDYDMSHGSIKDNYKSLRKVFDLEKESLIRFYYGKTKFQKNILLVEFFELICDGQSFNILINDFLQLYSAEAQRKMSYSYMQYCDNFNQYRRSVLYKEHLEFWMQSLISVEISNFIKEERGSAKTVHYKFGNKLSSYLDELLKDSKTTEFIELYALVNLAIVKCLDEGGAVIGYTFSGRNSVEKMDLVGQLVNFIPLCVIVQQEERFKDYAQRVKEYLLQAFLMQEVSYYDIKNEIQKHHKINVDQLFKYMITYSDLDAEGVLEKGKNNLGKIHSIFLEKKAHNKIHFIFSKHKGMIFLDIKYDTYYLNAGDVRDIYDSICNSLLKVSGNQELQIKKIWEE